MAKEHLFTVRVSQFVIYSSLFSCTISRSRVRTFRSSHCHSESLGHRQPPQKSIAVVERQFQFKSTGPCTGHSSDHGQHCGGGHSVTRSLLEPGGQPAPRRCARRGGHWTTPPPGGQPASRRSARRGGHCKTPPGISHDPSFHLRSSRVIHVMCECYCLSSPVHGAL